MGLQVWLPLNGNLDNQGLADVSVINNGATVDTGGKIGSCYNFNGSGYVQGTTDFSNFSDMVSLSMWVNLKASAGYQELLTIGVNSAWVGIRCSLIINSASLLRFSISDGVKSSQNTYYVGNIGTNTWVHVVGVYNQGEVTTYLNGIKTNTYTATITPKFSDITKFGIGANPNGSEKATCLINDVRIYNTALSPREVAEIAKGLVCHYPLSGPTPEQLFGDITEDNTIYSIRQSPDKHGAYDSIVGASVGWNQLVKNGDFSSGLTNWVSGGASTNTVSNNTATITVNNASAYDAHMYQNIDLISGHKYFISLSYYVNTSYTGSGVFCVALLNPTTVVGRTSIYNKHDNFAGVFNVTTQNAIAIGKIGSRNTMSVGDTITLKNVMLVDLTALFNQTIANYIYNLGSSSATWLRSHGFFTQDYYPYNPGQIKNVEGLVKRETVGNNLIDLESYMNTLQISKTENYYVDTAAHYSQKSAATPFPIKYIPNTQYCVTATGHKSGTLTAFYFIFYYTDGTSQTASLISSETDSTVYGISAAGKTVSKIVFSYGSNGGNNFYLKDLCVNISDSNFNCTYEPYVSHSYSYTNPPTLRGVYKLDANNNIYADGDIWDSNGSIKRNYAVMVLDGTNQKFSGSFGLQDSGNYVVYKTMPVDRTSYTICDRFEYSTYGISTMPLYSYVGSSGVNTTWSFALPNTITSLNEANAWLVNNPVTIIYKLAVPTTETSTKFTNPQIIEPYGTEAYSFRGLIPPGHITKYVDIEIEGGNYTYDESLENMGMTDNIEYDVSGYGYNGTRNGTFSWSGDTPRYNVSTEFDGVNSAIAIPWSTFYKQGDIFTLNVWWKKSELGSKKYETLFGGSGIEMDTRAGGASTLSLYMASTRGSTLYSPLNFNEWYMNTLVNDGTNELYYINGELVKTIEKKNMPTGNCYLGAWNNPTSQNYKGLMSDFRIYKTALSADDILELYHTPISLSSDGSLLTQGEIVES